MDRAFNRPPISRRKWPSFCQVKIGWVMSSQISKMTVKISYEWGQKVSTKKSAFLSARRFSLDSRFEPKIENLKIRLYSKTENSKLEIFVNFFLGKNFYKHKCQKSQNYQKLWKQPKLYSHYHLTSIKNHENEKNLAGLAEIIFRKSRDFFL